MTNGVLSHRSKVVIWLGAFIGFYRPGVEEVRALDPVSRFLYAARSVILVISAQAAIIAGLLAATDRQFHWLSFILLLIGLVTAHMISNLSNDYFDYTRGHDTPDSPRLRYTVHPLASGVLQPRALLTGLAVLAAIGLSIAAYFIYIHGWLAAVFFIAGVGILFAYDAAPVPLKKIGLGEIAVLLIWGPLMIGGGYAVITGHISINAIYASLPYGLGCMSILVGKHIDQRDFDIAKNIHTLPVLIGESAARTTNLALIIMMYGIIIVLIAFGLLTPFALVVLIAFPRAWHAISTFMRPRPKEAPEGYIGWPLWYHRVSLMHNRQFGWLYIFGLTLGAIWPGIGR
ncbi:MAG: prenyltransferase, partial [Acidiferrobacterales bacterium]|nr:prenyltransferase [Acidiferrobacterales bacterium]